MTILKKSWEKTLALLCVLMLCALPSLAAAEEAEVRVLEKGPDVAVSFGDGETADAGIGTLDLLGALTAGMSSPEEIKPGEMLNACMLKALVAGRRIQSGLRFTLEAAEGMIPAEELEAVTALLENLELQIGFGAKEGAVEVDLALVVAGEEAVSGKAYLIAEGIALETSLLPDKVLLLSFESIFALMQESPLAQLFDEETLATLAQSLPAYAGVLMQWAEETIGEPAVIEEAVAATQTRDAAVARVSVSATGDDYKRLYEALGQQFAADAGLHGVIAKLAGATTEEIAAGAGEFLLAVKGMRATANAYTADLFVGESGDLVGLDVVMPQMFQEAPPLTIAANYGRKTQDALATDTFHVDAAADDGAFALDVQYSADESKPGALTEDMTMKMRMESMQPGGISTVDLDMTQHSQAEISGSVETIVVEAVTTVREESKAVALPPDEDNDFQGEMSMGGSDTTTRVTAEVRTEALEGDDFRTGTQMKVYTDVGVIGIDWSMASGDFEPSDAAGKTVVDLLGMSSSEGEALNEEMGTYAMQAIMGAMGRLPQSVFSLFMTSF